MNKRLLLIDAIFVCPIGVEQPTSFGGITPGTTTWRS